MSVQSHLLPSLHLPRPSLPALRPEEIPERRREYSRETLLQFAAEKEERERAEREAAAGVGEGFGGFGGFGGGGGGGEKGEGGGGEGEGEGDEAEDGQPAEETEGEEVEREELSTDSKPQEPEEEMEEGEEEEDEERGEITVQLSELDLLVQQEEQVPRHCCVVFTLTLVHWLCCSGALTDMRLLLCGRCSCCSDRVL